jgi:hypothetical protein
MRQFGAPMLNTAPAIRWLLGSNILIHLALMALPAHIVFELVDRFAFISVRYVISGAWQNDLVA